jgi:hypothetical protein
MEKVPDGLGIYLLTFLSLHELEYMRSISNRWTHLSDHDVLWKRMVDLLLVDKQKSIANSMLMNVKKKYNTWRQIYWQLDKDGVRQIITEEEIVQFQWAFSDGERLCNFHENHALKMEGFGKLVWNLKVGKDNKSCAVVINDFPDHIVCRKPNWSWVMKNQYIYIITVENIEKDQKMSTREDINKAFNIACKEAGLIQQDTW